jgi:hypothetical protein
MGNTFVFSENGSLVAENLGSVNEAISYINYNICEIVENNDVNTLYAIVDFENQSTQFVKLQINVVPV